MMPRMERMQAHEEVVSLKMSSFSNLTLPATYQKLPYSRHLLQVSSRKFPFMRTKRNKLTSWKWKC